ncbi:hypothetical protein BC826DRAFT_1162034 [Russula brevipes]|nr:hypothetical protein BC826DRAFT_1162034 [Russula brevipes]
MCEHFRQLWVQEIRVRHHGVAHQCQGAGQRSASRRQVALHPIRSFVPGHVSTQVSVVPGHFASWPVDKPIVTNAKSADLASVLLAASLNGRSVHISDVQNKEDLLLIKLSKAKGLKVMCDVSIYILFFTRDQFGTGMNRLLTAVADGRFTLSRNASTTAPSASLY